MALSFVETVTVPAQMISVMELMGDLEQVTALHPATLCVEAHCGTAEGQTEATIIERNSFFGLPFRWRARIECTRDLSMGEVRYKIRGRLGMVLDVVARFQPAPLGTQIDLKVDVGCPRLLRTLLLDHVRTSTQGVLCGVESHFSVDNRDSSPYRLAIKAAVSHHTLASP